MKFIQILLATLMLSTPLLGTRPYFWEQSNNEIINLKDNTELEKAEVEFNNLLVLFDTPNSETFREYKSQFKQAAQNLKDISNSVFRFARIITSESQNQDVVQKYNIDSEFKLLYLRGGIQKVYSGHYISSQLTLWALEEADKADDARHLTNIKSAQELKEIKSFHKTVVAYFGEEGSDKFAAFEEASKALPDVPFVFSFDPALKEANRGHSLTIFTQKHNNRRHAHHFGRFTTDQILDYVQIEKKKAQSAKLWDQE